jgi:acyl-CoA synthetase (AMP-forming)/AMP-acid ligase II
MATSLAELLQATVEHHSNRIAVTHDGINQSYGQLWENARRIASFLCERGIGAGDRVALLLENSPGYIATYYGILHAGGVVVALNTGAKARDVLNWVTHCGASWLIADGKHPEFAAIVAGIGRTTNVIVKDPPDDGTSDGLTAWSDAVGSPVGASPGGVARPPDSLAAIIYTSGTTGNPKGVMLSHRNLTANVSSILSYLGLTSSDSSMNVLPFYYSFGNSVLHTHIAAGGRLVLENSFVYPHVVLSKMAEFQVTGFYGVPSTYALLLSRTRLASYDLSHLRYLAQAGGPMASAKIEQLLRELPQVRFFVMYGQTEATARLTYLPPARLPEKLGSVGVPIPGVRIRICNNDGKPVETGATGEIHAAGDNIMLGYWHNQGDSERVLRDGWLRTGDLAHCDSEGYIFIDGRSSDMIKCGAHRISPKDIEEVILELSGIEEVAVIGAPDDLLGQVVKAVIVKSQESALDQTAVQAHCRRQLPLYKVPKVIEFSQALPKTASGKIKRFLLAGQA